MKTTKLLLLAFLITCFACDNKDDSIDSTDDTDDVVDALEDIAYEIKALKSSINNGVYIYE